MKYQIINHGYDHAQYFQGCGTTFTEFNECFTGSGGNAKEAYDDAVEQIYSTFGDNADKLHLPRRPRGINAKDKVPSRLNGEESEFYFYVSIRFSF